MTSTTTTASRNGEANFRACVREFRADSISLIDVSEKEIPLKITLPPCTNGDAVGCV